MTIDLRYGDTIEQMKLIPDKSIDFICCDLPYGTTACVWDIIIPFDKLWEQYRRIIKDNGAIALFGNEPFSSMLRMSNIKHYKYDVIWQKEKPTNPFTIKKQFGKVHENISIFSNGSATSTSLKMTYNPQGLFDVDIDKINFETETTGKRQSRSKGKKWKQTKSGYPKSILTFAYDKDKLHPTQKPIALFEYLIRTYSNEGELVLDNTAGSGTTAIACLKTNRQFIVMEKEQKYYDIILKRVADFNKNIEPQTLFGNEM